MTCLVQYSARNSTFHEMYNAYLIFDIFSVINRNKSVENLLISSHEVISSINSSGLSNQNSATNLGNAASAENVQETTVGSGGDRNSPVSSPNLSPRPSPRAHSRREYSRLNSDSSTKESSRANKSDDQLSQVCIDNFEIIILILKYLDGKCNCFA